MHLVLMVISNALIYLLFFASNAKVICRFDMMCFY